MRPHIVIIGSGFGGIYSYKSIIRSFKGAVDVTIISKTDHFLFTPMLHEAVTLGVSDRHLLEDVDEIIREGDRFVQGEVTQVDPDSKQVYVGPDAYQYDYLVIAAGARTNFAGVPGANIHSYPLKNYHDVVSLRERIVNMFDQTQPGQPVAKHSFVIVGGGGTGVEMAAELAELISSTLTRHFGRQATAQARVTLISRGDKLLKDFAPGLQTKIKHALRLKSVTLITGRSVKEVSADGVTLSDESFIAAGTVIWTAGIKPVNLGLPANVQTEDGALVTEANLSLTAYPEIFAIGDIALIKNSPLPRRAQVASKQGKALGRIILAWHRNKTRLPFSYHSLGELVSIGQWYAVGSVRGYDVYGSIAWYIRRTVYLLKMITLRKKLKVSIDWTVRLFYHRELIVRD